MLSATRVGPVLLVDAKEVRLILEGDHHADVTVGNAVALDQATDGTEELAQRGHEAVLALTFAPISTNAGPVYDASGCVSGDVPSLGFPRASLGWTMTREVCASRLALPEPELVQNPYVPSLRVTTHVGVATAYRHDERT